MSTQEIHITAGQSGTLQKNARADQALIDLFSRPTDHPSDAAGVTIFHRLPENLIQQARNLSVQMGWLPDTPFAAAWVLLQQSWLGAGETDLLEPNSWSTHRRPDTQTIRTWVQEFDAVRRSPSATPIADPMPSIPFIWNGEVNDPTQMVADTSQGNTEPAQVSLTATGGGPGAAPVGRSAITVGLQSGTVLYLCDTVGLLGHDQADAVLAALAHSAAVLVADPDALARDIPGPSPEQREQLAAWNPSPAPPDPSLTVHGVFTQQVISRGAAPALIQGAKTVNYRELEEQSDAFRDRLLSAGVRSGSTVCVALGRGVESIVALLGILKAGATYLPLDPAYPPERIAFMLADAGACIVVTRTEHRDAFDPSVPALLLDQPDHLVQALSAVAPQGGNSLPLAYIMYTSGSTGTPKGIEIGHRSVLRLVMDANFMRLDQGTRMLHAAPLGFDASTLEIWGPLLNGGVCVLHDEDLPTPEGLQRSIQGNAVNAAWLTSALFNAVVDADPVHLYGLSQLLIGGEALSVPHVRRALQALPETRIINGYGPTECTTFTATYPIPADLPEGLHAIPSAAPSMTPQPTSSAPECNYCLPALSVNCM